MGFMKRCIEEKLVVDGILLRGPAGSGKSALMKVPADSFNGPTKRIVGALNFVQIPSA